MITARGQQVHSFKLFKRSNDACSDFNVHQVPMTAYRQQATVTVHRIRRKLHHHGRLHYKRLSINTCRYTCFKASNWFWAYPWTSQEQEWQRQPRQSRWHSASGLCWSCGASGARFWLGQTCDLHDTSKMKSRKSDQPMAVGPEISRTCSDTIARQPYVPAYWQQATVTGHRVRRKLHHQCRYIVHWSIFHKSSNNWN